MMMIFLRDVLIRVVKRDFHECVPDLGQQNFAALPEKGNLPASRRSKNGRRWNTGCAIHRRSWRDVFRYLFTVDIDYIRGARPHRGREIRFLPPTDLSARRSTRRASEAVAAATAKKLLKVVAPDTAEIHHLSV